MVTYYLYVITAADALLAIAILIIYLLCLLLLCTTYNTNYTIFIFDCFFAFEKLFVKTLHYSFCNTSEII